MAPSKAETATALDGDAAPEGRAKRRRGARVDYCLKAFEERFDDKPAQARRSDKGCIYFPVAPRAPELPERAISAVRAVVMAALRRGLPLVKYLYLAPKMDLERFVEFVTTTRERNNFVDLTSRPKCDTCHLGWKVCRRAQNSYLHFRSTGLTEADTHEWPRHGFSFGGNGHCGYIFLRCSEAGWPPGSAEQLIADIRAAVSHA